MIVSFNYLLLYLSHVTFMTNFFSPQGQGNYLALTMHPVCLFTDIFFFFHPFHHFYITISTCSVTRGAGDKENSPQLFFSLGKKKKKKYKRI